MDLGVYIYIYMCFNCFPQDKPSLEFYPMKLEHFELWWSGWIDSINPTTQFCNKKHHLSMACSSTVYQVYLSPHPNHAPTNRSLPPAKTEGRGSFGQMFLGHLRCLGVEPLGGNEQMGNEVSLRWRQVFLEPTLRNVCIASSFSHWVFGLVSWMILC